MPNREANAVTLRQARADDEEFIHTVYGSAREQELAMTPWDEAQRAAFVRFQSSAQQRYYQSAFPDATQDIILYDGEPIGRLYVDRREDEIRILDITLLTAWRGQGLGTPLLRELMAEAAQTRKRLTIYNESYNRSRTLFERLGFAPIESDGLNILFAWYPGG